jgi:hypothetical protein
MPQSTPSDPEFTQQDPFVNAEGGAPGRWWGPVFAYVVSSRQMNGLFSQVLTDWDEEIVDKNGALLARWKAKPHAQYVDANTKQLVTPTRMPRFDPERVYTFQFRIRDRRVADSKYTGMFLMDLPVSYERTEAGTHPKDKHRIWDQVLHEGDVFTRKIEFSTYPIVDCDADLADNKAERFVYRTDIGFELEENIGKLSSKGSVLITEKLKNPFDPGSTLPSRIRITKFPIAGAPLGLLPYEEAEMNDPGPDGWKPTDGTMERVFPP